MATGGRPSRARCDTISGVNRENESPGKPADPAGSASPIAPATPASETLVFGSRAWAQKFAEALNRGVLRDNPEPKDKPAH